MLWVSWGVLAGDGDDWARRGGPALAWTGDRLFVYGGLRVPRETQTAVELEPLDDAALIDPASGDVDRLPATPFEQGLRPTPAAAAVGDEVLLVGSQCRESTNRQGCPSGGYRAAVYSIPDDEWRPVGLPGPLQTIENGQAEVAGVTSDGRAVLVLGGREGFGALANRQLWVYDPGSDEWEQLPLPGVLIEGVCLARDVLVVGTDLLPEEGAAVSTEGPRLQVMDLARDTRGWLPTGGAGVVPEGDAGNLTCGDDVILFDDGAAAQQVFDLGADGGWRAPAPQPGDDVHADRLWTGEEFLFLDRNAPSLAYDPEADEWRGLEDSDPTGTQSVWTGEAVIGWPGRTDEPVVFPID